VTGEAGALLVCLLVEVASGPAHLVGVGVGGVAVEAAPKALQRIGLGGIKGPNDLVCESTTAAAAAVVSQQCMCRRKLGCRWMLLRT
jgi:hypothetical protein